MLRIIPKKLTFESQMSAKHFLQKLNGCIYSPKETGLFKVSKIIKSHFCEDFFYGSRRENAFTVFHHRFKKRDGGGVRFNGVVIDTESGCKIQGYLRQGIASYIFGILWVIFTFMITVVTVVENPPYALLSLGLMIVGIFVSFWDYGNSKRIKEFFENLCEK